jgi:methylamine dehydrogenase accessory protein MauD
MKDKQMPTGLWLYSYCLFIGVAIIESVLMIAILREIAALHTHFVRTDPNSGLPLGALAPVLSGNDLFGRPVSLAASRGKNTLLFFVSAGCSHCRRVMPVIPAIYNTGDFELVLIVNNSKLKTQLFLEENWPNGSAPRFPVVVDDRNHLGERYRVAGVPHVVVVDADGRIGMQGVATTASEVHFLVEQTEEVRKRRWTSGNAGDLESHLMPVSLVRDIGRGEAS